MEWNRTEKKIIAKIIADTKELLKDARARRVFSYILTMKPETAYKPGSFDETAFLLGQQSVCDSINDMIMTADREQLFRMRDEYISFINSYEPDYRKEEERE